MRKKRPTLKEKKQLYKTPGAYKAAKRKKKAERLNEEIKEVIL
jgi:hypothetical protein